MENFLSVSTFEPLVSLIKSWRIDDAWNALVIPVSSALASEEGSIPHARVRGPPSAEFVWAFRPIMPPGDLNSFRPQD